MNRSIRLAAGAFAALLCLTLAGCRGKQAIDLPAATAETAQTAETADADRSARNSGRRAQLCRGDPVHRGFQHRALHDVRRRDRHGVYKP